MNVRHQVRGGNRQGGILPLRGAGQRDIVRQRCHDFAHRADFSAHRAQRKQGRRALLG